MQKKHTHNSIELCLAAICASLKENENEKKVSFAGKNECAQISIFCPNINVVENIHVSLGFAHSKLTFFRFSCRRVSGCALFTCWSKCV